MSTYGGIERPLKLEDFKVAIKDMSNGEIENIKREVTNSLRHLDSSTKRLTKYIMHLKGDNSGKVADDDGYLDDEEISKLSQDDLELFEGSVNENRVILNNYNELIEVMNEEQGYRKSGKRTENQSAQKNGPSRLDTGSRSSDGIDMDNSKLDTVAPNSMYL